MERAVENAEKADLCLVLGSSLTVTPANGIPTITGKRKGAKLVICNLQKTPLDRMASARIWAKADDLMIRVMRHLDLAIPAFVLRRRLGVKFTPKARGCQLLVTGLDLDGTPATFLQTVKVERRTAKAEPYVFELREGLEMGMETRVELQFMGNYAEPNLVISHLYQSEADLSSTYLLSYDPQGAMWSTSKELPAGPAGLQH